MSTVRSSEEPVSRPRISSRSSPRQQLRADRRSVSTHKQQWQAAVRDEWGASRDAKIEAAAAESQKAIAAGATVHGSAGSQVGKIDALEGANVTITPASGKKIQVPNTGLRGNADGTVSIGFTGAQLDALVCGGSPAAKAGK